MAKKWAELGTAQRAVVIALGAVQLSLAASAWADLATRSREETTGSKRTWAAVIAVNFVGPLSYFRWGRRKAA